ncbi:TerD family protein [Streptomyces fructofermentans]|uniref:TerD-family protein n=1 Tax=Streptomyces fructofermentans TaxID=152141 RepID=A0A918KPH8_9ACTN|nr:TerD family protein [Streptomyces fructofermentans]GGX71143.1 TerD-family protein [Streptomyces fructofermentans]
MNGLNKGISKAEVSVKWDPSPVGEPATDLDVVAATYLATDPHGAPDYVVHFGSRSPDGTIYLDRDSKDGKGFGWDEVMTLELTRLDKRYARVVVGVAIQQRDGRRAFGDVRNPALRIREAYTVLAEDGFAEVLGSTATTVGEFLRDDTGEWLFHSRVQGYDADPAAFALIMGSPHES